MKKLTKPGDNLGGLLKIWAIPYGTFSVINNTVYFTETSNIWEIYCSPDSMQFTEANEITPAGTHFNTSISGFIPNDNALLQQALYDLTNKKWGVIYIDGNGNYKIAGNQTDPLRFTNELNTGKDTAALAGCSFQFSGKTKTPSNFINKPF